MNITFHSENLKRRDRIVYLSVYGAIMDFENVEWIHLAQDTNQ
jgi:hypothetical protein